MTVTPSAAQLDHLVLAELDGSRVWAMNAATSEAEEVLALSDADDQRRVAAGADDDVRGVGVHGDQGERAVEPAADLPHRLGEVAAGDDVDVLASRCATTSVSVSDGSSCPRLGELCAQRGEILDDPVVDHRDRAGAVEVGVRVAVGRRAVGRPPGVPHACRAPGQ